MTSPMMLKSSLLLCGLCLGCGSMDASISTGAGGGSSSNGGGSAAGGGSNSSGGGSASTGGGSAATGGGADAGSAIDPNQFWANDPPPMWCGPDGGTTPPMVPGGTPDCPDDKNRQGCACANVGEQAPCWPGLRANRGLGICKDGVTTCQSQGEFGSVWGECKNYVLPQTGATSGAAACKCFSAGRWAIANVSPCFISDSSGVIGAVSTFQASGGNAQCPTVINNPPTPEPGTDFSTDTLQVDCAGHFKLCFELKAGKVSTASAADCSVAKVCVESDYATANTMQTFPDLPSWTSPNPTCAKAFADTGGYGEMSVVGESVRCDTIDDGMGGSRVFNRVQYCPVSCNQNPTDPMCTGCGQGGSGTFGP
jgi:hypothetical protein